MCIPFLESLHTHFDIGLIITQPDSKGGRGRKKIIPAVKRFALEKGIDFIQPGTLKGETPAEKIKKINPCIAVVIAYGKIIPKSLFTLPEHRTVNVHFSMLPFYRGAAPVQRAIENGEKKTGITIFRINRKMDSGAVWDRKEFDILASDTTGSLWQRLSREGAPFLVETLKKILAGKISKTPQDHSRATYAPPVEKEESKGDWSLSAEQIYDKFRAFTPWPGLSCTADGKIFKITKLRVYDVRAGDSLSLSGKNPGDVLSMDKESIKICCGRESVVEIVEIQPQGKKPMTPYCYCLGNELPGSLT